MIGGRGLKALLPDLLLPDVSLLTPAFLHERGFAAVIFDIDNTLVTPDAPATEAVKAYFERLHTAGIRTYFVSNNGEARVKPFAGSLNSGYTCHAKKPSGKGYREALLALGLPAEKVLTVGDQLFTDIWGASRAGIFSVLVDAVDKANEQPFVRVKRIPEKAVRLLQRRYFRDHLLKRS